MPLSDEERTKREQSIRERKCHNCGKPITLYQFNSVLIPFEIIPVEYLEEENENMVKYPIFSFDKTPLNAFNKVVLSSTCECGCITFWNCDKEDFSILTSDKMQEDGFGIDIFYHKQRIESLFKNVKTKNLRESLEHLIKMFPK